MIKVFYDGQCGMCSREIGHYRAVAPQGVFEWIDITKDPAPLTALGVSQKEGLKALHVQDDNGQIVTAVASFRVIWKKIPRYYWLYTLTGFVPVRWLADRIYPVFARWRFRRLGYESCKLN